MAQKVVFITTTGAGTFTVPVDFGSLVSVEGIGGGGAGINSAGAVGGGGGGAYASSNEIDTSLWIPGTTSISVQVGTGGTTSSSAGTDTWFGSATPTTTTGILAKAGGGGAVGSAGAGGLASASVGTTKFNGGTGGAGGTNSRGAGGGAGGPGGAGGTGGDGNSLNSQSGGGGGGSGATLTVAGTAGQIGQASNTGGTGGASAGQTGGSAGTATVAANSTTAPANGGGGGGGGGNTAVGPAGNGAAGTYWTSSAGATAGSGGGGGGTGNSLSGSAVTPGNGGLYGGGGGSTSAAGTPGAGAQGIIVFTYNSVVKTVFITTTGTGSFTVPSDFVSLDSVEAIGGGGDGTTGNSRAGGGGGYARTTSITGLVSGQTCFYRVGIGGGSTTNSTAGTVHSWFNTTNALPSASTTGCLAYGGFGGSATGVGGGVSPTNIGSTVRAGGNGAVATQSGGGGGGAAGPGGVGGAGGLDSGSPQQGGGGGGGGASLSGAGSVGGTGTSTAGGAGGNGGAYLISYINSTKTQNASNSTSLVIKKPIGTIDGDLMIAIVNFNVAGETWTGPAGWTEAIDSTSSAIYYKIASSEPDNYAFTTINSGTSQGYILTYRNAAWDTIGTFSNNVTSPEAPAITATGTVNTIIAYFKIGNTAAATFTTPSNYTAVDSDSGDTAPSSAIFSRENFSAGTTGTVQSTVSVGNDARGILFSIKPSGVLGVPAGGGVGATNSPSAATSGTAGTGGGGGGNFNNAAGGAGSGATGSYWTSTQSWNGTTLSNSVATAGSGGGGGGAYAQSAGNGGLYGGGGGGNNNGGAGSGAQGIIVFTYSYNQSTYDTPSYDIITGFRTTDENTNSTQDLGSRYITKSYLLDAYPNIASSTGSRVAPGLWVWGANVQGCLGIGSTGLAAYYSSPVQVGTLTNWKQVSGVSSASGTRVNWSTAIKTDGTLWAWGGNAFGQLGNGNRTYYSSPVQVGALTNWKQVAAGQWNALAVKTDGTLWAWGANVGGQLGLNSVATSYFSSPVQVGALTNWKQVALTPTGGVINTTCAAVKTDGTLWTWGHNLIGAMGINTVATQYYSSPIQVGALTNWKQVSLGMLNGAFTNITVAVKTDGTLWSWGSNLLGTMGINTVATQYYSSPIQVGTLNNWKQVSTNGAGCFAIKTDGTLWAWGWNACGHLGINSSSTALYYSSPIQVGSLTNWKYVNTNNSDRELHSVSAIKTDGTLWTWGCNSSGELGNNTRSYYSSPIQVGSLTTWKSTTSAGNFMLAIQDGYI